MASKSASAIVTRPGAAIDETSAAGDGTMQLRVIDQEDGLRSTEPTAAVNSDPIPGLIPYIGTISNWRMLVTCKFWIDLVTSPIAATAVYFITCMYLNCVSQVYVQRRAWDYFDGDLDYSKLLPDVGFDAIPEITGTALFTDMNWADFVTYSIMAVTAVRFFFGVAPSTNARLRQHILRRHLFALGTLFILRSFAILSTLLPNPLDSCEDPKLGDYPWIEGLKVLAGQVVTCADVMYSGHTVNITLCGLDWHLYSHAVPLTQFDPLYARNPCLTGTAPPVMCKTGVMLRMTTAKVLAWVVVGVGYIIIIGTHFHYTLDVFIGALLSIFVFKYYITYARAAHLCDNTLNRIVVWLEHEAEDLIEYRTELPHMMEHQKARARSMTHVLHRQMSQGLRAGLKTRSPSPLQKKASIEIDVGL